MAERSEVGGGYCGKFILFNKIFAAVLPPSDGSGRAGEDTRPYLVPPKKTKNRPRAVFSSVIQFQQFFQRYIERVGDLIEHRQRGRGGGGPVTFNLFEEDEFKLF